MERNEIDGRLFRKGALRRSFGVVVALMIVVLAVMAQYGLSADDVDSRIASNDFVDVGFEEDMNREKVHLDFVEKTLTRKCLLVESWNDALGAEDLSFYLRDSNFDASGKAELYSVEKVPEVVKTNLVYEDVPYECGTHIDNETQEEVPRTCYTRELKSYDNVTVYYDEDVFVGEFDFTKDLAAGSTDFSGGERLKLCFNTPIVKTASGWGNAGTVFVGIGDRLLVDKQGSSWWNDTYDYKRADSVTHTSGGQLDNFTYLANGTDGFSFGNGTQQIVWVRSTLINSTNYIYYTDDFDYAFSNQTEDMPSDRGLCYDVEWGNYSKNEKCAYDSNYISVYHFGGDVGTDNIVDSIGTDNMTDIAPINWTTGKFGVGYGFTKTNGLNRERINEGKTETTISLWFNLNSFGAGGTTYWLLSSRTDDNNQGFIHLKDNVLSGNVTVGGVSSGVRVTGLSTEEWYHYAMTCNQGTTNVYINGVLNGTVANGNRCWEDVGDGEGTTYFGAHPTTAERFDGYMDEIRISDKVRTSAEIKREYEMGLSAFGAEETPNTPPSTPAPAFNVTTAYNLTNLNCSADPYINDEDADNMNVMFNVTVDDVHVYEEILSSQPNGSQPSIEIRYENYSKGDNVSCWMTLDDGKEYSSTNLTSITIINSAPSVDSFNASSLNRSRVHSNLEDVNFSENETVRFSVTASDDDGDEIKYDWLLEKDGVLEHITNDERVFEWPFNFTSDRAYTLTLKVNDTSDDSDTLVWNIDIENVVNKFWTVGLIEPTPPNGSVTHYDYFTVKANVGEVGTQTDVLDDSEGEFSGTFTNTSWDNGVKLAADNVSGTYTSSVYGGVNSSWENVSFAGNASSVSFITDGLKSWWRLDEDEWTGAVDEVKDSFGTNHGTAHGGATTASGKFYNAGKFIGVNDYVEADWDDFNMTEVTIEFWMKASMIDSSYHDLVSVRMNEDNTRFHLSSGTNSIIWYNVMGSGSTLNSNVIPVAGEWYHVAGTYDGTTARVYVNGVEENSWVNSSLNITSTGVWISGSTEDFNGSLDEVRVYTRALNSSEVLQNYVHRLNNLTLQVRSCDDSACSGESFVGPGGTGDTYYEDVGDLNVSDNRYFQYKAYLDTNTLDFKPELHNVSFSSVTLESSFVPSEVWVDLNGTNESLEADGAYWKYDASDLLRGNYTFKVYANDSYGNVNVSSSRTVSVSPFVIYFNVTSGEDGSDVDNIDSITCDYSGFSKGADASNPYGPYEFPVGSWQCSFEETEYYTKIQDITVNSDGTVSVVLEREKQLTIQEHDWLRDVYDCLYYGDCRADDFLENINGTVDKIWNEFLPTDESVVTQEDTISSTLSSGSNITINYTIDVPYKEGYDDGDLLPIRIFFWFTDDNDKCYSQDKQSDSNRAESPFCIPLMAEYLGPNNGTVSFKVDLRPDLDPGTYEVVRSIDIDPIVNNEPVWINYGREIIGSISVVNEVLSSSENPEVESSAAVVEARAPVLKGLDSITGKVIDSILDAKGSYAWVALVGLIAICMTVLGVTYMRRPRW